MSDQDHYDFDLSEEILRLSIAAHCGDISAADANRLNTLLAKSELARRTFLIASQDAHDLRNWATEHAFCLTELEVIPDESLACSSSTRAQAEKLFGLRENTLVRSLTRQWKPALFVATAAALAAVTGIVGWRLGQSTQQINIAAVPMEPRPSIAQLTMASGCSWGGNSPQFTGLDSPVRLGDEIALHEGIAEFRLSSGVSLSIEGPAALVLTSPTSLVMQHGRATIYVPGTVEDFRLVTSACRMTGRQTEFGVLISGGDVDVHAFAGQVLASPALGDEQFEGDVAPHAREEDVMAGSTFYTATIQAGRGLALTGRSDDTVVARWHKADETQFATKLSMAGLLPINRSYVNSILASKPIGYWRFESAHDGLVKNEIGDIGPLVVFGQVQFLGDSSNRVVDLGRPESAGFLYNRNLLDLSKSDYSVELWVKPSHAHTGGCVAFLGEVPVVKKEQLGFYLQLCGRNFDWESRMRGRFRFLHRSPMGADHATGTSCTSQKPASLRRWQHVVAIKQESQMRLFVDGVLTDEQQDETKLPPNLGMVVGQLTRPKQESPFCGQLDELAIYGRALSPEEVKKHFDLVQWKDKAQHQVARDPI